MLLHSLTVSWTRPRRSPNPRHEHLSTCPWRPRTGSATCIPCSNLSKHGVLHKGVDVANVDSRVAARRERRQRLRHPGVGCAAAWHRAVRVGSEPERRSHQGTGLSKSRQAPPGRLGYSGGRWVPPGREPRRIRRCRAQHGSDALQFDGCAQDISRNWSTHLRRAFDGLELQLRGGGNEETAEAAVSPACRRTFAATTTAHAHAATVLKPQRAMAVAVRRYPTLKGVTAPTPTHERSVRRLGNSWPALALWRIAHPPMLLVC